MAKAGARRPTEVGRNTSLTQLLGLRSWTWAQCCGLLVLYAVLASPLALQIAISGSGIIHDKVFQWNVVATVCWMALAQGLSRKPVFWHIALYPLYLTTCADLFLLTVFKARLSSGYLGVSLANRGDTGEFLSLFWLPIVSISATVLVIHGVGLFLIRKARKPRTPVLTLMATFGLLGSYGGLFHHFRLWPSEPVPTVLSDVVANEFSAPLGAIFQSGMAVKRRIDNGKLVEERRSYVFNAVKAPSNADEIYVWVIGESSRPQNWSLFGYDRDTTPRLRNIPGIIALSNVMTTAPETELAVPSMLSLQPINDWPAIQREKSIVSAFNEAGFKTFWLSTQDVDGWAGLVPEIADEASAVRYFANSFDGAMLQQFHKALSSQPMGRRKLLIIMHTKGSHFDYDRRFPPEFTVFRSSASSPRDRLVDNYDNSVLYTDWFLSQVVSELAALPASRVALLYASDHGENLLDDSRQIKGHARGTTYDLATAAFFWMSDSLRHDCAEQVANLEHHSHLPLTISDLPHSMLDLAGIEAPAMDLRLSLFSAQFEPQIRYYALNGTVRAESAQMARQ